MPENFFAQEELNVLDESNESNESNDSNKKDIDDHFGDQFFATENEIAIDSLNIKVKNLESKIDFLHKDNNDLTTKYELLQDQYNILNNQIIKLVETLINNNQKQNEYNTLLGKLFETVATPSKTTPEEILSKKPEQNVWAIGLDQLKSMLNQDSNVMQNISDNNAAQLLQTKSINPTPNTPNIQAVKNKTQSKNGLFAKNKQLPTNTSSDNRQTKRRKTQANNQSQQKCPYVNEQVEVFKTPFGNTKK